MSDKRIEDYLHLYLGCNFQCKDIEGWELSGKIMTLTPEVFTSLFKFDLQNEIKPILRPLSDMTEEEMLQVARIFGTPESNIEGMKSEIIKEGKAMFHQTIEQIDEDGEFSGTFSQTIEFFRYLLSKHFDLFGLIDSGLAIQPPQNEQLD